MGLETPNMSSNVAPVLLHFHVGKDGKVVRVFRDPSTGVHIMLAVQDMTQHTHTHTHREWGTTAWHVEGQYCSGGFSPLSTLARRLDHCISGWSYWLNCLHHVKVNMLPFSSLEEAFCWKKYDKQEINPDTSRPCGWSRGEQWLKVQYMLDLVETFHHPDHSLCHLPDTFFKQHAFWMVLSGRGGGGLLASGPAYQLRMPSSSLSTRWPLFFGNTAEWLKITPMLPQHYPRRDCKAICARSFCWQHEPLNQKRGVT